MPPVHRIAVLGLVNAYLVEEDDGLTLVDTLLPRCAGRILKAAGGAGGIRIKRIALTHAHADHIGSLDVLAEKLPGVEVLISGRDARLLAKDLTLDPGEEKGKLRGGYAGARTRPTRTFEAGERIGSLEVIAAPGHTPGQVAFLDTRDRTLYCGDAYSTVGGVATTAKTYPRFPLPAKSTWHHPTALESAQALRALEPARLAPGHGKVVESPGAAMDAAIARGTA
jgi:glyoxylase-like metal-dependent hydrolase (beta-lactamase superfamily II)